CGENGFKRGGAAVLPLTRALRLGQPVDSAATPNLPRRSSGCNRIRRKPGVIPRPVAGGSAVAHRVSLVLRRPTPTDSSIIFQFATQMPWVLARSLYASGSEHPRGPCRAGPSARLPPNQEGDLGGC